MIPAVILIHLVLNVMSPLEGEFKRKLRNMTLSVQSDTAEAEVLSNHVIQMPGIVNAAVL